MKVTIETPALVDYELAPGPGPRYWLTFESRPNVDPGETYRTFAPALTYADTGSFLALHLDGNRLHVKALDGWTPCRDRVILPSGHRYP